jgi:hypothetical protein
MWHTHTNISGEKGAKPVEVRVEGCDNLPCTLKRGEDIVAEVDFLAGKIITFLSSGTSYNFFQLSLFLWVIWKLLKLFTFYNNNIVKINYVYEWAWEGQKLGSQGNYYLDTVNSTLLMDRNGSV